MSHSLLAIRININVLWLPFLVVASAMAGMLLRTAQLKKAKKKVLSLENEMMRNHAEILKLQQKQASLEKSNPDIITPVLPFKEQPNDDKKDREGLTQQKKAK